MQDTHFDLKLENCIRAEWGYKCYFASYNSSSRGVAVLFHNNLDFSVKKVYKDIAGNYIFVTVEMMDRDFLIVCMGLTRMILCAYLLLNIVSLRCSMFYFCV